MTSVTLELLSPAETFRCETTYARCVDVSYPDRKRSELRIHFSSPKSASINSPRFEYWLSALPIRTSGSCKCVLASCTCTAFVVSPIIMATSMPSSHCLMVAWLANASSAVASTLASVDANSKADIFVFNVRPVRFYCGSSASRVMW